MTVPSSDAPDDAPLFDFYRGNAPLMLHDARAGHAIAASRFALDAPLVLGTGDPHPENFGLLEAADGTLALEPNDFDAADRLPYLWDVRRLVVGIAVAVQAANADDPTARQTAIASERTIARAAASAYAAAIHDLARGAARARIAEAGGDVVLADLFERGTKDLAARAELAALTTIDAHGARRLLRGAIDPTDPENVLEDLPAVAAGALPEALRGYRATLADPPDEAFFRVEDAARELGAGIASWPRVRALVLVRGPSDDPADDVILEVKELADSGLAGLGPLGVAYPDVATRVRATTRAIWATPGTAPLWGTTSWVGFPVQVRRESEGEKSIRTKRLVGERGTVDALVGLAITLGNLTARVHASPTDDDANPARAIAAVIDTGPDAFADEQADVALAYAAQVPADLDRLARIAAKAGPTLGVPRDPSDAPPPALAALYGTPPP